MSVLKSVRIACREPEAETMAVALAVAWAKAGEEEQARTRVARDWPLAMLAGLTLHWAPHSSSPSTGTLLVTMDHVPGGRPIIEWIEHAVGHEVACSAG